MAMQVTYEKADAAICRHPFHYLHDLLVVEVMTKQGIENDIGFLFEPQ